MKDQDKLKQIIEYAVKNGWSQSVAKFFLDRKDRLDTQMIYMQFIFDHSFCKAVFGEEEIVVYSCDHIEKLVRDKEGYINSRHSCKQWDEEGGSCVASFSWQYHIQRLALEEEDQRIDYIYKFIMNN